MLILHQQGRVHTKRFNSAQCLFLMEIVFSGKQLPSDRYKPSEVFAHASYFTPRNSQKNLTEPIRGRKIKRVLSLCKLGGAHRTMGLANIRPISHLVGLVFRHL